ncbi:MAG: DUF1992 domain-containing protein [Anaerolineaceae bacterium]|nr:DUF1992 domain-containing protein [Anaerolineaceae bacterium]
MSRNWESYIDRAIRQAIEDGKMDNKPGQGQPLRLDEDKHTPPELRMAHKLLKDNDLLPDWMLRSRDLETRQEKLAAQMEKAVRQYQTRKAAAAAEGDPYAVEIAWKKTQDSLREAVESFNKAVLSYNLQLPPGVAHRPFIDLERALARLLDTAE